MLCTHCGEPLDQRDTRCPLCGKAVAASPEAPPSLGEEKDEGPRFVRRMRFERPGETESLPLSLPPNPPLRDEEKSASARRVPPLPEDAGEAAEPLSDDAPPTAKPRPRRPRSTPLTARMKRPVDEKSSTPDEPSYTPPQEEPAPPPPLPPDPESPPRTPKSGALGVSPLAEPPEEQRQTSEELKRVLQTVFATSPPRQRDDIQVPRRPLPPPPVSRTPEPPRPTAPSPRASRPPSLPPRADDWSLGETAPRMEAPFTAPTSPRRDTPVSAPPPAPGAPPKAGERRLGPDLADFWSLGTTKPAGRPEPDADFEVDEPDVVRAQDGDWGHDAKKETTHEASDLPETLPLNRRGGLVGRLFAELRASRWNKAPVRDQDDDGDDEADTASEETWESPALAKNPEPAVFGVAEEVEEIHITVAGFPRRAVAALLDRGLSLMLSLLFLLAALSVLPPSQLPAGDSSGLGLLIQLMLARPAAFSVALFLWLFTDVVLNVGCTLATGQTPGKMLLGLRVIQVDGEPVKAPYALLRVAAFGFGVMLAFLGPLWAAVDSRKQGLHDKLAGTYVIRAESLRE